MRNSRRPLSIQTRQSFGGAVARLAVGIVGALMLLAAPLCVGQAQSSECDTMAMMPMDSGDHHRHDQGAPTAKPDCAVGCRLVPQLGPQVIAPMRVVYEVQFETEQRTPAGIIVDPAVPPPRGMV
jgi:hypothetical protein